MIIGLTVLGLLYYNQLNLSNGAGGTDFERILPAAINNFLPAGILGLCLPDCWELLWELFPEP